VDDTIKHAIEIEERVLISAAVDLIKDLNKIFGVESSESA